ncbi:MAG TPA: hypothetical protein VFQ35_18740 [Polyangiaceae bacterium]|nr:hypothetical protein [Polyangiaceae bacterium]
MRSLLIGCLLALGCGSSSTNEPSPNGSCPSLAGAWTVTKHCDASLVGMTATVNQQTCSLSFASPFNGFSGQVTADGAVTLSGPQSCTGSVANDAIDLTCTPGTCLVTLSR